MAPSQNPNAGKPIKRSRKGCWPCKGRKVKCGEERPGCLNCQKAGSTCDYSVRLNWTGRPSRTGNIIPGSSSFLGGSAAAKPAVGSVAAARGPLPRADSTLNPPTFIITNNGSFTASPTSPSPMQSSDSPMLEAVSEGNQGSVREPRILGSGLQTPMLPSPSLSAIPVDKDSDVMNDEPPADRPSKRVQLGATRSGRSVMPTPTGTGCAPNLPQTPALLPEAASTRSLPRAGISMPSAEDGQTREADLQLRLRSGDSRLTVSSLLTASLPDPGSAEAAAFQGHPEHSPDSAKTPVADEPTVFYGVDHGLPDLDLGKNNDGEAIDSGSAHTDGNRSEKRVEAGGYYEKPVSIYIPRRLEPLPAKLMENPMNLLYFHHFLSKTANILVPFDDELSNPFRSILPEMALRNDHLLSLLLAYSASHRARILQHPEPATRIAMWVQDIFPALRHALSGAGHQAAISNANVATAIMLASLEIISPTAFGYTIPWYNHLALARELITARPRGLRVGCRAHRGPRGEEEGGGEEQICSFLWSWFAYLDVLGSLSCGPRDVPSTWILDYTVYDSEDDDEIDCIMGFTTRCVYILAEVAELTRECDALRASSRGDIGTRSFKWSPPPDAAERGRQLEHRLRCSMATPARACAHIVHSGGVKCWDWVEMSATNLAYHWAALAQLYRRVFGHDREDPAVKTAVKEIFACLECVRRGGTAEGCLLFPMFTAGCETTEAAARDLVLERMVSVEKRGMTQVENAKKLMQCVWKTGKPWWELVNNEFIG